MSGRGAETLDGRPRGPSAAAGRRLRVRNIGSWDETLVLHPGWNELLASSASRTVFLTREWLQAWWDAYGGARELMLLVCLDDGGSVVGVAPLFRARRRVGPGWSLRIVRLLGDGGGDSDNLDFIAREGCEAEVVRVVVDYLADHASEWDLLELNHVPAESAIAKALEPEVATRGWRGVAREAPRRVIRLSQTWEGHLGKLSKKMRREANHDVRRLEGLHHVGLRRCESEAELPSCLEALFRLDAARWGLRGEAGNFGLPQRRGFYAEVARRFLAAGRLDFWLLDVDGRPAAAHFGFRYAGTHYYLDGGFDPAYRSLRVGVVLMSLVLARLIGDGVRWCDFQEGDERYKARWGAERRAYRYARFARPRSLGALYLSLARWVARGKEWVRTRAPGAWRLVRGWLRRVRPSQADLAAAG